MPVNWLVTYVCLQLQFRDKTLKGDFVPQRNKDALYMALGEKQEALGRAYGFGGDRIGIRKAFGKAPPKSNLFGSTDYIKMMRDEINNRVRDEVSAALSGMGMERLKVLDSSPLSPPALEVASQEGPPSALEVLISCDYHIGVC